MPMKRLQIILSALMMLIPVLAFATRDAAAGDSIVVIDTQGVRYMLKQIDNTTVVRDTVYLPGAVEVVRDTIYLRDTRATVVADSLLQAFIIGAIVPSESVKAPQDDEYVIINGDTVDIIIPERNYGRYDRGLFNYLYIPKGQWSFGLTASYGGLQTQDLELLNVISDVNVSGTTYSVKPYISYFFNHNSSIGMRMNYTHSHLDLNSLGMDFGDDLNFDLSGIKYKRESYSASIFYRHYIGLDRDRRFGIFNEVDLAFGSGLGQFVRNYNSQPRDTRTNTVECRLNFSPGLCVFIQENVSFNVSFGVFGLYFKRDKQKTDGVEEGSRYSSGADFKFNVFNINLGIAVHI